MYSTLWKEQKMHIELDLAKKYIKKAMVKEKIMGNFSTYVASASLLWINLRQFKREAIWMIIWPCPSPS